MYSLGLAYRGTAQNGAISRLLHHAVTDVADDVRRAAVMCLGFVLMGAPEQCPRIVALLAESFNPHMRYGAAMAVGLACPGQTTSCGSMLHECCGPAPPWLLYTSAAADELRTVHSGSARLLNRKHMRALRVLTPVVTAW